ncbi:putative formin-like protein 6 isoform X1 [Iris pallida]|uniref:Formin-like protein 6 isoform X1 n=1 Tax=Iris pallida TaxID=29817 RepID=A0AAX6I883_IRIPA|nr:putative formin-like protein 6 isoform X1 [Iris pallida]
MWGLAPRRSGSPGSALGASRSFDRHGPGRRRLGVLLVDGRKDAGCGLVAVVWVMSKCMVEEDGSGDRAVSLGRLPKFDAAKYVADGDLTDTGEEEARQIRGWHGLSSSRVPHMAMGGGDRLSLEKRFGEAEGTTMGQVGGTGV